VRFSTGGSEWDRYYDKQTGFLVQETRDTALLGTETVKLVATNMWSPTQSNGSLGLDMQTIAVVSVAIIGALGVLLLLIRLRKRKNLADIAQ
jgi:hypothetical protein